MTHVECCTLSIIATFLELWDFREHHYDTVALQKLIHTVVTYTGRFLRKKVPQTTTDCTLVEMNQFTSWFVNFGMTLHFNGENDMEIKRNQLIMATEI